MINAFFVRKKNSKIDSGNEVVTLVIVQIKLRQREQVHRERRLESAILWQHLLLHLFNHSWEPMECKKLIPPPLYLRILRCLAKENERVEQSKAQTDEKLQIARLPTCLQLEMSQFDYNFLCAICNHFYSNLIKKGKNLSSSAYNVSKSAKKVSYKVNSI